jgi:hypothetical protein
VSTLVLMLLRGSQLRDCVVCSQCVLDCVVSDLCRAEVSETVSGFGGFDLVMRRSYLCFLLIWLASCCCI